MKVRIALETGQDISDFVEILDSLPPTVKVYVTDNNNFRISARSMLFLAVLNGTNCGANVTPIFIRKLKDL